MNTKSSKKVNENEFEAIFEYIKSQCPENFFNGKDSNYSEFIESSLKIHFSGGMLILIEMSCLPLIATLDEDVSDAVKMARVELVKELFLFTERLKAIVNSCDIAELIKNNYRE